MDSIRPKYCNQAELASLSDEKISQLSWTQDMLGTISQVKYLRVQDLNRILLSRGIDPTVIRPVRRRLPRIQAILDSNPEIVDPDEMSVSRSPSHSVMIAPVNASPDLQGKDVASVFGNKQEQTSQGVTDILFCKNKQEQTLQGVTDFFPRKNKQDQHSQGVTDCNPMVKLHEKNMNRIEDSVCIVNKYKVSHAHMAHAAKKSRGFNSHETEENYPIISDAGEQRLSTSGPVSVPELFVADPKFAEFQGRCKRTIKASLARDLIEKPRFVRFMPSPSKASSSKSSPKVLESVAPFPMDQYPDGILSELDLRYAYNGYPRSHGNGLSECARDGMSSHARVKSSSQSSDSRSSPTDADTRSPSRKPETIPVVDSVGDFQLNALAAMMETLADLSTRFGKIEETFARLENHSSPAHSCLNQPANAEAPVRHVIEEARPIVPAQNDPKNSICVADLRRGQNKCKVPVSILRIWFCSHLIFF